MKRRYQVTLRGNLMSRKQIIKEILQVLPESVDENSFKVLEQAIFQATKNGEEWEYKDILFEKVGQIISNPEMTDKIIKDVQDDTHIWESCVFYGYKKEEDFNLEEMLEEIKVEKGEFKCRNKKCRSNVCYFFTSQTRSRDEGATVYVVCTKCHNRYKFN